MVAIIFVTRPLTVLFHELGHAIPAIIFTRKKVTIYLGSHGDTDKSFKIKIGLLEMWIRPKYCWTKGLCEPSSTAMSNNQAIIFLIGGTISSLLIASVASYFIFKYDMHGALKLIIIVFLISSIFDFVINIVPSNIPIKVDDGELRYNDGNSLLKLFHLKKFPAQYEKAVETFNNKDYKTSAILFENFLRKGLESEEIFRLAITSFIMIEDYAKALEIETVFKNKFEPNADDYCNSGFIKLQTNLLEDSITYFQKALVLNPDHNYSLNNLGYVLATKEQYTEALTYLDKAIELDKQFAYAYTNRGFVNIKLGKLEDGLSDLQYSMKLDTTNSYTYRNLGIYHLNKNNKKEALVLFQKAKELDPKTESVDDFIRQATCL